MALFVVVLFLSVGAVTQRPIKLTDKDKAQIVESILVKENLLNSELRPSEERGVIYLSTDNLPSNLNLKIPEIKVILLKPDEIKEREENGLRHLAFGKFRVDGSKVEVLLNDTWQNIKGGGVTYRALTYKCQKVSGKWVVKPKNSRKRQIFTNET